MLRRLETFIVFLAIAALAAGIFGAIHNQFSYTVSTEYFTKFKFIQFDLLDTSISERIRAAEVGFLASWRMGLYIGILSGVAAFHHKTNGQMRAGLLWSLLVIASFTLAFALAGLAYGFSQTGNLTLEAYNGWFIPDALENPRRFICAGYMHNAAYLGGAVSIPVAWIFHFLFYRHNVAKAS